MQPRNVSPPPHYLHESAAGDDVVEVFPVLETLLAMAIVIEVVLFTRSRLGLNTDFFPSGPF